MHECSRSGEIESIKQQNENQFARLSALEEKVEAIKTDLIGVSGTNGLRGEFRQYQTRSEKREEEILHRIDALGGKLEAMDKARDSARRWTVRVALGLPTALAAVGGMAALFVRAITQGVV